MDILASALDSVGPRLARDEWPEYYDGRYGRLIGREARRLQTWTVAGYLIAAQLAEDPDSVERLGFEGSAQVAACSAGGAATTKAPEDH